VSCVNSKLRIDAGFGFDLPMNVGAIAVSLPTIIVIAEAQLLRRMLLYVPERWARRKSL
jgi:hypothetical protein